MTLAPFLQPANVSPVRATMLAKLRAIVGNQHVKVGTDADVDPGWDADNLRAGVIVAPSETTEVAAIVQLCRRERVAIVPQGGRTGLVGGAISKTGQIVLSLGRMNCIERLDPIERTAVVQSGVTLEVLQNAASEWGLEPGIDLPSRGSATIGGMVSTNAGGITAFRNGVMRHQLLGIEAVLPDGTIYSDMTRVVKHAAGYDLKHLFVGAEGTLGIVTRAVVKLLPAPRATATALFGLPSVSAALDLVRMALDGSVGQLRAAEALWRSYIQLTASAQGWVEPGFDLKSPVYLLLSLSGAREDFLREEFERLFSEVVDRFPEATGIVPSSQQQEEAVWRLREDTDSIYRKHPMAASYDVSVPLSEIGSYVDKVLSGLAAVDAGLSPYIFGHIADGNLHIVLNRRGPLPAELASQVEAVLYDSLAEMGGSFSAEHGVGSKRIHSLVATVNPNRLALMIRIKSLLDSDTFMNPGKILPLASLSTDNTTDRSNA